MDNEVLVGIAGEAVRAVHLCRRAGARVRGEAYHSGGYRPIVPALEQLDTDHLTLEFSNPGAGDVEVFEQLPEHLEIGLGCVSVHPGEIDDGLRALDPVVASRPLELAYLGSARFGEFLEREGLRLVPGPAA